MPERIQHPSALMAAAIAMVVGIFAAGRWVGALNVDRAWFKEFMVEVRNDIKEILRRLPPATVAKASPRALTNLPSPPTKGGFQIDAIPPLRWCQPERRSDTHVGVMRSERTLPLFCRQTMVLLTLRVRARPSARRAASVSVSGLAVLWRARPDAPWPARLPSNHAGFAVKCRQNLRQVRQN